MGSAQKNEQNGLQVNPNGDLEVEPHSELEVNWAAQHNANLPKAVKGPSGSAQQPKRICGLSPKKFWIILVVVILIVIGAAVGGSVGATVNSKDSSTPSTNSTEARKAILPNGRLATLNFTENQVEHTSVFFQSSDASLYQTLWNSSVKVWTVAPVILNGSDVQIKENTPLAASVRSDSRSTFFLFFLDTSNRLRSYTSSSISGPWTVNTDGGIDKRINVPPDSPLLAYSNADTGYVDSQFVMWQQDTDGKLQLVCMSSTCGQSQTDLDAEFPAMNLNSSLAVVPLYTRVNANDPQLAMYGYTNGLWEAHYTHKSGGQWNWTEFGTPQTLGVNDISKMTATASLAAFTIGWYVSPDNRTAPEHLQVLWTLPGSKGVSIKANKNETWLDLDSNVAAFGDVVDYSAIAANQAGRVYAVENAEGDKGVQLVEWQFFGDNASYERIGVVDTTVPQ